MTDRRHLLPLLLLACVGLWPRAAGAAPFAYVANRTLDAVTVIDTATDTISGTITLAPGTQPQGVAIAPNGKRIYVGSIGTFTVSVADAATNAVTTTAGVLGNVISLAVKPGGSKVYCAGGSITIKLIDTAFDTFAGFITSSGAGTIQFPQRVAFNPSGTRAYVANGAFNNMVTIDTATQTVISSLSAGIYTGLVVSPDGARLYGGNAFGPPSFLALLSVVDTATNTSLPGIFVTDAPREVALHPDGVRLFVSLPTGISVVDTSIGAEIQYMPIGSDNWGIDVHPDGTRVYLVDAGAGTVTVLDADTLGVFTTIPVGGQPFGLSRFIGPAAVCGDGIVTFPEQCDDGNTDAGDCCAPDCTFEAAAGPCADDGSLCTTDQCNGAGACLHPSITCDDGNLCTTDGCNPGTGCTTTPITCDDLNACTANTCIPATGCAFPPITCDDGDACTTDGCDSGTGCTTTPITCTDGDVCTDDGCNPLTGCTFTPRPDGDNDGVCDDIDPCTGTAALTAARLKMTRLGLPLGDERYELAGRVTLPHPFAPPLNPAVNGVRLLLSGANGPIFDTTIAGGAGWSAKPTRWTFSTHVPSLPASVSKIAIWDRSASVPGELKFVVQGRNGAFPVGPTDLPLAATLVFDPPTATTGQCGAVTFTCVPGSNGKLTCR
jgi:YVTN family beta-propeller protein/cysteine-rich repeat protein